VIVVGAGSGGGVAAARIAERLACRVLVLEAGRDFPDEETNPPGFITGGGVLGGGAGVGAPVPELDWGYWSEPLENGRRLRLWRGKLVGGSSMINGCVAVRAKPDDFARWAEAGAEGWAWEHVVPFYEAVQARVPIKTYPRERWQPIQEAYYTALTELGYREVSDINAPDAWDGVCGAWPVNRHNEIRGGTLVNYLRDARRLDGVEVRAGALVDRVLIENGRAVGVRYCEVGGEVREVRADLVILSAGAYGTPPILLRSGIGPAAELAALGIETVADLPVGKNLRDHPGCRFTIRADPRMVELTGSAFSVIGRGDGDSLYCFAFGIDEHEGICALPITVTTDRMRGQVRLGSADDPSVAPLIDHGFQGCIDRGDFDHVEAFIGELLQTPTMRRHHVRLDQPELSMRERLLQGLGTSQHPVGTCAIGAVVDSTLSVFGIEALRIVDASVFPQQLTSNPNLTCYMIGERAAAFIEQGG
jgi:choline dehydrogenase